MRKAFFYALLILAANDLQWEHCVVIDKVIGRKHRPAFQKDGIFYRVQFNLPSLIGAYSTKCTPWFLINHKIALQSVAVRTMVRIVTVLDSLTVSK